MGSRGPVPLSRERLRLRGSWRAGCRPAKPKLDLAGPSMPSWMNREAKAEWRRVVPVLTRLGVLTRCDRALLTAYCCTWARFVAASRQLESEGLTLTTSNDTMIQHPLVGIQNQGAQRLLQLAQQLGLTPMSRQRLDVAEPADEEHSEKVSRFFDGPPSRPRESNRKDGRPVDEASR